MVNIQNAPAAPAPGAGLEGLAELLSASGVFKDVTGLDANQQNVLKTYLSNQENAKALAQMASGMAMQAHNTQNSGRIMDSLKAAKDSGALSSTEYGKLVQDHLRQQIDGGQTKQAELKQQEQANPSLTKAAVDAATLDKNVKALKVDEKGNVESVDISKGAPETELARAFGIVPPLRPNPKKRNDCWAVCATMLMGWRGGASMTVDDVMVRAGARYTKLYNDDTGLPAADKEDFVARLEMEAEPPASYGLAQYVAWIKAFGPLWVTTDAAEDTAVFSPHARILTRITGSVDDVSARLTFLDPRPEQRQPRPSRSSSRASSRWSPRTRASTCSSRSCTSQTASMARPKAFTSRARGTSTSPSTSTSRSPRSSTPRSRCLRPR